MVNLNEALSKSNTSNWSQRFILSAILQSMSIIIATTSGTIIQLVYSSKINIIQFLSLSFEGPAKWIFLGYIFYLILITLISMTATFYNHLEKNLRLKIRGVKSLLAWVNLIGVNVGGAVVAITLIYAGLVGSGIFDLIITGNDSATLKENPAIMNEFVIPIVVFVNLLIVGAIVGSILYFATYFQNMRYTMRKFTVRGDGFS
ncbi:MAG TPA: hypothetical protein VD815_06290 [Candidatus Saccharimonadales bacterium]|nr:hypothetical protein [Candidatus Saccharimonadales bacterium]